MSARQDASGRGLHAGIFLLCMSALVYEIALTRIFSALMYYHFASMAIAVAFLGMGLAGMLVYIRPRLFDIARPGLLPALSLLYAASVLALYTAGVVTTHFPEEAAGVLTRFHQPYFQPFRQGFGGAAGGTGFVALMCLALATMVPFLISGLGVSAILSGAPNRVGTLYFADLSGAAVGALLVIPAMSLLGGPGALLLAAAAGALAASSFGRGGWRTAAMVVLALSIAAGAAEKSHGLARFDFVGGRYEPQVLDTKWNSYSRVMVYRGKNAAMQGRAWGVSRTYTGPRPDELNIVINDTGYTTMVADDGGAGLDALRYDVTNLPFMLKGGGKTLVIGPGGGRDVLSALVFGSKDVTAVEVNPLLKDIVDGGFGPFTGRLYSRPGVELVVDDGRSFLMRSRDKYDVIESARVYEWMESASGAFSLSENYLYTKEAFRDYLSHLEPGGVLSITRFIFEKQAIRILSLAMSAYEERGVARPADRVAILKERGLATFLFKVEPFTTEEVAALEDIASRMGFEVIHMPGRTYDNEFSAFLNSPDPAGFIAEYPLELAPSTDDKPFFNFMVKKADFIRMLAGGKAGGFHNMALVLVFRLFVVLALFSVACFVLPLLFRRAPEGESGGAGRGALVRPLVYFACIGLGFITAEVTFLRKFILFLGHPVYSLSVVLFIMLVSAGLGSALSSRLKGWTLRAALWLVPLAVASYAYLPDPVFREFMGSPAVVRAAVSAAMLFPAGLLLGTMFPAGIRAAESAGLGGHIPWFWAINGVFSVLGTLFALLFAMCFGFNASLLACGAVYLAAAAAMDLGRGRLFKQADMVLIDG